jgi:aminoglycoside phosphotransferase (APT) family kinase protein
VAPWRLNRLWGAVSVANLARATRRLGGEAALPDGAGPLHLGRQFRSSALLARTGPQTLLHGDPHPRNTYATAGGRTGFYDWQLARSGSWSHDVAYFVAGSLDPAARRAHEADLVRHYLGRLHDAGVEPPGWDEAWARYRAGPAFGLATWLHTLAFGSFQPRPLCLAMIRRYSAAYEDLETARSPLLQPR